MGMTLPVTHGLALAAVLFVLGLVGLVARRNFVFMLISLEIMLNAAGLAFIVAGQQWQQADGQVMFIFVLTLAAAEVGVALGLLLQMRRRYRTLDIDVVSEMRG